jgi:hypothetical protein
MKFRRAEVDDLLKINSFNSKVSKEEFDMLM